MQASKKEAEWDDIIKSWTNRSLGNVHPGGKTKHFGDPLQPTFILVMAFVGSLNNPKMITFALSIKR